MTDYPNGQSVDLTAGTVLNQAGQPVDPDTLDLTIQLPDGTTEVHHKADLTRISTGLFLYPYLPPPVTTKSGFAWEFVGTTPAVAARGSFYVDPDLAQVHPIPPNDLAWIRAQIGSAPSPTDFDLAVAFARIGGKAGVALEVWSGRLADMERTPTGLGADGLSISTSANLAAMQKRIAKLEILARAEGSYVASAGSGFMVRRDRPEIGRHLSESQLLELEAVGPFPYGGETGVL